MTLRPRGPGPEADWTNFPKTPLEAIEQGTKYCFDPAYRCPHGHSGPRICHARKGRANARTVNVDSQCYECLKARGRVNQKKRNDAGHNRNTAAIKEILWNRQGEACALCNAHLPYAFHVDHIVPFVDGGEWSLDNLRGLCPPCHRSRPRKAVSETPLADEIDASELPPLGLLDEPETEAA